MAKKVQSVKTIADISTHELKVEIFQLLKSKIPPLDTTEKYPMVWIWHGIKFILNEEGKMSIYDTSAELIDGEGKRTYTTVGNKYLLKLLADALKNLKV